jgi:hypothetical protein
MSSAVNISSETPFEKSNKESRDCSKSFSSKLAATAEFKDDSRVVQALMAPSVENLNPFKDQILKFEQV